MDHLLQLKPVKFLEGELIHDLLKIFVSEKLEAYQKFYENHREFVNNLGLTHEDNIKKMKLLTFMQLAETKSEIRFGEIQQHMQISEAEVEEFLIDVLKTKLVRAKIDQGNQVRSWKILIRLHTKNFHTFNNLFVTSKNESSNSRIYSAA